MKISLLQLNFLVGDFTGNTEKIIKAVEKAAEQGVDLCVSSELGLTGYPPRDLLLNTSFVDKAWEHARKLASSLKDKPPVLVGLPEPSHPEALRPLYNSAVLIQNGEILNTFRKVLLPNYDVFDEVRYFEPSPEPNLFTMQGYRIGVTICEDIWNNGVNWVEHRYKENPVHQLAEEGVDILINLSASPFTMGKQRRREHLIGEISLQHGIPFLYVNQVGGNDDLVFDGRSCVFDSKGRLAARAKGFEEDVLTVDMNSLENNLPDEDIDGEEEAWRALVLGTRDYVGKSGFTRGIIGLSGGIDSSLTAAIAVEALGPENVLGVLMPSPFTSRQSVEDALSLAHNLNIQTLNLPITSLMEEFDSTLAPAFQGYTRDVTEENLQARIRGNLLMALSNKYGSMLLSTGNKSELAVGYCTIYGDMSGGFAVISDVPKTLVFAICRWLNACRGEIIPVSVLEKAPSAELKENQTDQDLLPSYDTLDKLLFRILQGHTSVEELVEEGFDRETTLRVMHMVKNAEFKRKQTPPGIKITDRAFGTGWRMPIASKMTG